MRTASGFSSLGKKVAQLMVSGQSAGGNQKEEEKNHDFIYFIFLY